MWFGLTVAMVFLWVEFGLKIKDVSSSAACHQLATLRPNTTVIALDGPVSRCSASTRLLHVQAQCCINYAAQAHMPQLISHDIVLTVHPG